MPIDLLLLRGPNSDHRASSVPRNWPGSWSGAVSTQHAPEPHYLFQFEAAKAQYSIDRIGMDSDNFILVTLNGLFDDSPTIDHLVSSLAIEGWQVVGAQRGGSNV